MDGHERPGRSEKLQANTEEDGENSLTRIQDVLVDSPVNISRLLDGEEISVTALEEDLVAIYGGHTFFHGSAYIAAPDQGSGVWIYARYKDTRR